MILSMTGYGKAESQIGNHKLIIELRGLNSKQMDLSVRLAPELRDYELEMRQQISQRLERGKIDLKVEWIADSTAGTSNTAQVVINKKAFIRHYEELKELKEELGIKGEQDMVNAILRIKDVLQEPEVQMVSADELLQVKATLQKAMDAFTAFRQQEGKALQTMFTEKLDGIATLLAEVEPYEKGRIKHIREHLEQNLQKLSEQMQQAVDKNRLEQEMIYYLEKLDITEEKVRLRNHIRYFRETMEQEGEGVGKKLGFVAQEMGREINTLGSKSNQSEMQIIVVKMKDILEQIKEQVLNVL